MGLWHGDTECAFPATVVLERSSGEVGLQFDTLTKRQQIDLVQCTFARSDVWQDWSESHDVDRPLHGLQEIAQLGLRGYRTFWKILTDNLLQVAARTVRWRRLPMR